MAGFDSCDSVARHAKQGTSAHRPLTPLASDQQRAASIADQQKTRTDPGLSPVERLLVAALVSAMVKELQAAQPPLRPR